MKSYKRIQGDLHYNVYIIFSIYFINNGLMFRHSKMDSALHLCTNSLRFNQLMIQLSLPLLTHLLIKIA